MSKEEIKTYTLKEIAEHSSSDSLWLLIDNSVYDVTKFKEEHPGGEEVLLDLAGQEATDAFEDVGHSSDAKAMMKDYKVGELCKDDKKEKGKETTSSNCYHLQYLLIPVGVVFAAVLFYKLYSRSNK